MRQQFRATQASAENAPEGHLWFDLITGERDTFKTRLKPEGARFHSEARPWLNTHNDKDAAKVIGNMIESRQAPGEPFRVLVKFDMPDPNAAEIYRKHKDGVVKGCSVGFLPIPGKYHVEMEPDGQKTIVYDEYYILEGSSCGVPSNPTALMRSAELVLEDALAITGPFGADYDDMVHDNGFDAKDQEAFLKHFPAAKTANKAELIEALSTFKRSAAVKPATPSQAEKRAVPTVTAPTGIFSTDVQGKPMKPEHRAAHRALIGDTMRAAEDHIQLHAAMPEFPEHREFHAGEARSHMKRANLMCRMVHDSLHEAGEATPESAPTDAKVGALMRSAAPSGTDATLAQEWDACRRSCAPYMTQSFRDVGEKIAKTPSELRTKWVAAQAIEAMHRKAILEKRNAAETLEAQQRAAIIEELKAGPGLEPGLECEILGLDPTDPKRETRSGEPMSLADLISLRTQLVGAAQVLTRTAPLTPSEKSTETPDALKQGAPAERSAGQNDIDPKVRAALEAGARSAGLNLDNALAAARRMS